MLKWLVEQGFPLDKSEVFVRAVSEDHLHVMKWMAEFTDLSHLWTPTQLFDHAAEGEYLDVVEGEELCLAC